MKVFSSGFVLDVNILMVFASYLNVFNFSYSAYYYYYLLLTWFFFASFVVSKVW
jgi:hypothetical protein